MSRCMLCAKPSVKTICDECSDRVRGEAAGKKRRIERNGTGPHAPPAPGRPKPRHPLLPEE